MRRLRVPRRLAFPIGLAVVLFVLNVIAAPQFASPQNLAASLGTLAPFVLVSFASTPAILTGGIDLSIGPLAIFTNCLLVSVLLPRGLGAIWIALPILLVSGAAVGAINGVLVTVVRFHPIIATLGTFFILTGLANMVSPSPTVAPANWTSDLAGSFGVVPGAALTMLVPAIAWVLLTRTALVGNIMAVGGDDVTAFSAGVNVTAVRIVAYAFGGLIAAVAGIALTAVVSSSSASLSSIYALIALAAVVLGGTTLGGGNGGFLGSFLGAASLFLLQTVLTAVGVSSTYLQVFYGAALVVGVASGAMLLRNRKGQLA